jgi:hypothetical protein
MLLFLSDLFPMYLLLSYLFLKYPVPELTFPDLLYHVPVPELQCMINLSLIHMSPDNLSLIYLPVSDFPVTELSVPNVPVPEL